MGKVIINGRFLIHRVTGVERYAKEILNELDKIIRPGEFELAIPSNVIEIPKYNNINVVKVGKLNNRLWEHISFPIYVERENGISLNLCNVAPLIKPGITCIHDMKIKATPQYFNKKFLIWYNLLFLNQMKRAKYIITVSEFSKKEICRYYNLLPDRIEVIYNAWQHYDKIDYDFQILEKYKLKSKHFYFAICSLEPNKNLKWIAEVAKRNKEDVFVVAGSINKDVFADGLGFECPNNMILVGYISDEEAKTLMKDCKAFLFPTFYEGFGIPPLEAICAGTNKVVVSDLEIMHEIFGDNALYIDPYKYDYNLDKIIEKHDINRNEVLNKYSWANSALKLYKLIKEIV